MFQLFPFTLFSTTELIAFANCTKISQNTSDFLFPKKQIGFWVVLPQLTAISWHLFQLQLPSCLVGCWKGKIQVLWANPQPLGMTSASFFSPDLVLQVQMHLSVYKLVHCLFILEDLASTWICQKHKFPQVLCQFKWGLFLPSWLLPLSCAVASYALCWLVQADTKGWSWIGTIQFFGGEKNFATSLVLDQTSWLLKWLLPFLTILWTIHLSLTLSWKNARACTLA